MDPFADTLRRLREAFSSGRTRPAEFRAAQLKALRRFLQENKQLLQEALVQDLHKVGGGAGGAGEAGWGWGWGPGCAPNSLLFISQTLPWQAAYDSIKLIQTWRQAPMLLRGKLRCMGVETLARGPAARKWQSSAGVGAQATCRGARAPHHSPCFPRGLAVLPLGTVSMTPGDPKP